MKKFTKLAVAGLIAGFGFAAQAGVLIDNFNTQGQFIVDNTTGGGGVWDSTAVNDSANILGGYRDIFAQKIGAVGSNPSGPFPGTGVTMGVYDGRLNFNTATGDNATGLVRWDGANTTAAIDAIGLQVGGLGVNFSAGANAFKINVFNSDQGFPFAIEVYTDANRWSRLVVASVAVTNGVPDTNPISFSDFVGAANLNNVMLASGAFLTTGSGGSADLSNVGALQAIINLNGATSAVDLSIDTVMTVPEPTSVALIGIAMLGLGAVSRRKSVGGQATS